MDDVQAVIKKVIAHLGDDWPRARQRVVDGEVFLMLTDGRTTRYMTRSGINEYVPATNIRVCPTPFWSEGELAAHIVYPLPATT